MLYKYTKEDETQGKDKENKTTFEKTGQHYSVGNNRTDVYMASDAD